MEASPKFDTGTASSLRRGLLSTQGDKTLAMLAARGNTSAFDTIHARYHRRIFVYVYGLLGRNASAEDAEDLTQEVFHSAFRSLESQRPDGSLKAWLYTIARNRTFDHLRANRVSLVEITDETMAAAADTEQIVAGRIELAWLMTALDDLPERQREALVLREMGGLSYGEIAATLATTEASVKQLLTRARTTVVAAANAEDVRAPRRLGKSINSLFPAGAVLPGGAGIASALGLGGGGAAFGAGGGSTVAKFAVGGVLAATLLGGGAVGVKSALDDSPGSGSGGDGTPSLERVAGPAPGATDDRSSSGGGNDNRTDDSDRGGGGDRSSDGDSGRGDGDGGDRSSDGGSDDKSGSREAEKRDSGSDDPSATEAETPSSDGGGSGESDSGRDDSSVSGDNSGSGSDGSSDSDDPPDSP